MIRRRGVWDVTLGIILALLGGQAFAQHAEVPSRGGGVSTASAIGSALYCEDAGGDDTYVCTLAPAITTLDKLTFTMRVTTGNTGAATVNVNGLGAKSIKKAQGGVTTDPADNDIRADAVLVLSYDGTNFQLQSTLGNAGAGTGDALVADPLSQFAATTSAQFAGVISDETGTGAVVLADSPTLVTPALGTPSAATLTNATGLPIATGVSGLGANVATALATPSSANVAAMITDETGTGAAVFANTPTLVTPVLGAATGTSIDLTGAATIEGGVNYCLDAVGTDSYACSLSPAITAYSTGTIYAFKAGAANTGAATLNLNAIGSQSIVKTAGGVTTALADNDIRSGSVVQVAWDGTNFQLVSPVANASSYALASGNSITGCVAGGVLRSISNLVECGAGITWSGGTLTLNNGAAAVSPFIIQDNGTPVVTVADNGETTFTQPVTISVVANALRLTDSYASFSGGLVGVASRLFTSGTGSAWSTNDLGLRGTRVFFGNGAVAAGMVDVGGAWVLGSTSVTSTVVAATVTDSDGQAFKAGVPDLALTSGAAATFAVQTLGNDTGGCTTYWYTVRAYDATTSGLDGGMVTFCGSDVTAGAGGEQCSVSAAFGTVQDLQGSTLSVSFTSTAGTDLCNNRVTATTDIGTPTALTIKYGILNSGRTITHQ